MQHVLGGITAQGTAGEAGALYWAAPEPAAALRMAPLLARCERALNDLVDGRNAGAWPP